MSIHWLQNLPIRASVLRTLRSTLDDAGFIEVETPVRIPAPANEPYINPPPSGEAFLRASPELQMKQLLSKGFERIYQMGPCFRSGERGTKHNPEFTLLEWYRANDTYLTILGDLKQMICQSAIEICGSLEIEYQGQTIDLARQWEKIPVREAMKRYAGWDPVEITDPERFDFDMATQVEPALPKDRPCVLINYPAHAASLSQLCHDDPRLAERWELYIAGIELCNAYGELTNATIQRQRFEEARQHKINAGETPMPLDEAFLDALNRFPPAGGAAMGVDRLVMLLANASSIDTVRPFCPPIGELW